MFWRFAGAKSQPYRGGIDKVAPSNLKASHKICLRKVTVTIFPAMAQVRSSQNLSMRVIC